MKKPLLFWPDSKTGPQPSKGFGGPLRVISTTVLIFLASQLVVAIFASILIGIKGDISAFDDLPWYQLASIFIAESLAVLLVFYVLKNRGLPLASIGLGRRPIRNDLVKGLTGFAGFYVLIISANIIIGLFAPNISNGKQDVGFNNLGGGLDNLIAFVALVILPPLGEEVLVRGYLFSGLRKSLRLWQALLITSLLFALPHLFETKSGVLWAAGIDTFLLSIVLVYLREKTGALYAGMVVHMLNNLLAFLVVIK